MNYFTNPPAAIVKLNVAVLVLMLFPMYLFTLLSDAAQGNFFGQEAFLIYGYLLSLITSLLSLKWRWFFILSSIGWIIFIGASQIDRYLAQKTH